MVRHEREQSFFVSVPERENLWSRSQREISFGPDPEEKKLLVPVRFSARKNVGTSLVQKKTFGPWTGITLPISSFDIHKLSKTVCGGSVFFFSIEKWGFLNFANKTCQLALSPIAKVHCSFAGGPHGILPIGESSVDFRRYITELSPVANVLLAKVLLAKRR
jgi:hypothetical protein